MADFVTAVKYKLPIKVVIIKNNTLGQIKWEQMVFLGNPEYGVDLHPIDFAAFAHACGGIGFSVEDPADCGRVFISAIRKQQGAVSLIGLGKVDLRAVRMTPRNGTPARRSQVACVPACDPR